MIAEVDGNVPDPSPSWRRRCATVRSASVNDWGAVAWSAADGFVEATPRATSRSSTGSAAATASPPVCSTGSWSWATFETAVEYGAAHGALAMTTPGDTSTARLDEVRRFVERPSARIQR